MGAIVTSLIVFACVFGGALIGMLLRAVLPAHHFDDDTKDVIKRADCPSTGMVLMV